MASGKYDPSAFGQGGQFDRDDSTPVMYVSKDPGL